MENLLYFPTATAPTPEMFAAMMKASLGDDVYNEDDSVKKLERYVATLCGHEEALFCASGTMVGSDSSPCSLIFPPPTSLPPSRLLGAVATPLHT